MTVDIEALLRQQMEREVLRQMGYAAGQMWDAGERPPRGDGPQLSVKKIPTFVPVTVEQLVDVGLMEDTRPPVRYPWHVRLRSALAWRVLRVRWRVGGWVAGVDLDELSDEARR